MKINVRAFTIAFTTLMVAVLLVISVWSRVSGQFGLSFMDMFGSVHPHPYPATQPGQTLMEHLFGVALDIFYVTVDSIVFSLGLSVFYNKLAKSGDEE